MTDTAAPQVYKAISAVMAELSKEGISKSRRSGDGGGPKFQFRGIDDVYNALAPILAENGLMILPRMIERSVTERATQKGGTIFYTVVEAEFDLVSAEDGSKHTIRTFGEAMDSSDKSTNKAMSAAFKYAAVQAFCIPTEGDNDADAVTHEVQPRQARQTPTDTRREPTLSERADKLENALRDAAKTGDVDLVKKTWGRGSGVCAQLDTADPTRLVELTKLYDELSDPIPF